MGRAVSRRNVGVFGRGASKEARVLIRCRGAGASTTFLLACHFLNASRFGSYFASHCTWLVRILRTASYKVYISHASRAWTSCSLTGAPTYHTTCAQHRIKASKTKVLAIMHLPHSLHAFVHCSTFDQTQRSRSDYAALDCLGCFFGLRVDLVEGWDTEIVSLLGGCPSDASFGTTPTESFRFSSS